MEGVMDLVPRSDRKSLYIVWQKKTSLLDLEGGGADRNDADLGKLFPCLGLYSDPKNNLYVLMEKRLLKMNEEGKIIRTHVVLIGYSGCDTSPASTSRSRGSHLALSCFPLNIFSLYQE